MSIPRRLVEQRETMPGQPPSSKAQGSLSRAVVTLIGDDACWTAPMLEFLMDQCFIDAVLCQG